jgi:hypothetical protein
MSRAGSLIWTRRGTQGLLNDELAKGLGVPKAWMNNQYPLVWLIHNTVDVHLIEYFTNTLVSEQTPSRIKYYVVHNGTSHNPALHGIEVLLEVQIEVVHVLGTSMIQQGTDGLSR